MRLPPEKITLGSGTLSGGARIAAAAGGLPQRLTVAADKHLANVGTGGSNGGVCFDPDGLHIWAASPTANNIRKIRISDGAVITTFTNNASDGGARTITTPQHVHRNGTLIYFANTGTGNYLGEINTATLVCRLYSQATLTAPVHCFSAESGKAWARTTNSGNATYNEFSLSGTGDAATATATGRTVAGGYAGCIDGGGVYAYFATGSNYTRYKLSDGTTTTLAAINSSLPVLPGYFSAARAIHWNPALGKLVVSDQAGSNNWMTINSAFTAIDGRVYGYSEFGGPVMALSSNILAPGPDFTGDGLSMAFTTYEANANATVTASARVVTIGVQRWRAASTAPYARIIEAIAVPGQLANAQSSIENEPNNPSFLQNVYDHRKTRCYYSLDGGSNRTEFVPGDPLSVSVPAGGTLTVDIDMTLSNDKLLGPRPWVATSDGLNAAIIHARRPNAVRRLRGAA